MCYVTEAKSRGHNLNRKAPALVLQTFPSCTGSLPVLEVPGEVGLSVVLLGFAEVAGSNLVSKANL